MTDQVNTNVQPESNQGSQPQSLADIMAGKAPTTTEADTVKVEAQVETPAANAADPEANKTKADEKNGEQTAPDPIQVEKDALKKRVDDTQRWGQTQRQAVLTMIKGLKESGVEEDEIKKLVGGDEVYQKVLQNIPVEQHLQNDDVVMQSAFNNSVSAAEAVLLENGETVENLKKYLEAFNTVGMSMKDHRDEMLRRASSGGNVAAYVFKHGKELLPDFELEQKVRQKGLKSFLDEQRVEIRSTLEQELNVKKEQTTETKTTPKKPELVGGSPAAESRKQDDTMTGSKSLAEIMGR